jgi:quercetin dioxygenase-like cupin family protein
MQEMAMRINIPMLAATMVFAIAIGSWAVSGARAQQESGLTRSILQTRDLGTPGRVAVMARVEFQPGAVIGRHTHPGEEIGYVLEGTLVLEVDGKPPVTLKAGESYFIEAGRVHGGRNGNTPASVLTTYVVEKGKPLATAVK